jgi:hypothetical protein
MGMPKNPTTSSTFVRVRSQVRLFLTGVSGNAPYWGAESAYPGYAGAGAGVGTGGGAAGSAYSPYCGRGRGTGGTDGWAGGWSSFDMAPH